MPPTDEELLSVVTKLKEHTGRCLSQLCGMHVDGPEFVGTGNVVSMDGKTLLLTAGHVVLEIHACDADGKRKYPQGCAFTVGNGHEIWNAQNPWTNWPTPKDVCAMLLPEGVRKEALDAILFQDEFALNTDDVGQDDLYVVHGFPGTSARFSPLANGMVARTLPFGCFLLKASQWTEFDTNLHFAVTFSADTNKNEIGNIVETPNAGGISGSLLWKTNAVGRLEEWSPKDARVVGLVHRYNQSDQCLIATKAEYVKGLLRHVVENSNAKDAT